jgi:hypothetical protein
MGGTIQLLCAENARRVGLWPALRTLLALRGGNKGGRNRYASQIEPTAQAGHHLT